MPIRAETANDHAIVHQLHSRAFGRADEADLVERLRVEARPLVSLVATLPNATSAEAEVVGHILFTPVKLSGHPDLLMMGLAPMAVHPAHQRQGLGAALIESGLDLCRRAAIQAVVVLGHPEYYPRFGFVPASQFGIGSEYDVPDEVFMARELSPGALTGRSGQIHYHEAFAAV